MQSASWAAGQPAAAGLHVELPQAQARAEAALLVAALAAAAARHLPSRMGVQEHLSMSLRFGALCAGAPCQTKVVKSMHSTARRSEERLSASAVRANFGMEPLFNHVVSSPKLVTAVRVVGFLVILRALASMGVKPAQRLLKL